MSFIKKWTVEASLVFLDGLSDTLSFLGGPVSRLLNQMVQRRDYLSVIKYQFDYDSIDVNDAIYSRQIQALFAKQDFLDLGVDKDAVTLAEFLRCEEKCRETNARLRSYDPVDSGVELPLWYASQKIAKILGECPSLDSLDFSFGPGVTTSTKMDDTFPRGKLSSRLECSTSLLPLVGELLSGAPHWADLHSVSESDDSWIVEVSVTSGKLAFVPKSSLTNRPIVVEPILNGYYQKGFGKIMKKRLMRVGIDLTDQTRNRDLALRGSVDGSLATIDLSSASDTLSYELVWHLLPFDWAEALSFGRSSSVKLPSGAEIELSKFSSMGNAYTFELESLIFYALAYGVCKEADVDVKDISVFGDDIIAPSTVYARLVEVLEFCGFSVNTKKSFCSGPFRESCGSDILNGIDIRPFYQRELVSERTLFMMHNFFVRNCEPLLASYVHQFTRSDMRIYGPDGYGDGHLIGSHRLRLNRKARRDGWGGGYFDTYTLKKRFNRRILPGDAVLPVYSIYAQHSDDAVDHDVIRGSCGYTKSSIYTLATTVFRREFA